MLHVAIQERLPLLETFFRESFSISATASSPVLIACKSGVECDVVLSDEREFFAPVYPRASVYLIPSSARILQGAATGVVLSGGMRLADAVTLSSIREEDAMLCVQREIRLGKTSVLPFERPIPFDRRYSIYKNIAVGFCRALTEELYGDKS